MKSKSPNPREKQKPGAGSQERMGRRAEQRRDNRQVTYSHSARCTDRDLRDSLTVEGVKYCGCCKGLFEPNGKPLNYHDKRIRRS